MEEEELLSQVAGTVFEAKEGGQLEESMRERRQRQRPNMEETEPRRSLRLAKKRVTMGRQGTGDDPEVLPYYVEAVKRGWAGTKKKCLRNNWRRVRSPVWSSIPGGKSTTHRAVGTGLLMGSSAGQHR